MSVLWNRRLSWQLVAVESTILVIVSAAITAIGLAWDLVYVMALLWLVGSCVLIGQVALLLYGRGVLCGMFVGSFTLKLFIGFGRFWINGCNMRMIQGFEDEGWFWKTAIDYSNGLFDNYSTRYPYLLAGVFRIVGINYPCCMLISVMLVMAATAITYSMLDYLGLSGRAKLVCAAVISFLPFLNIVASYVMREPIYVFCVTASLMLYLRYIQGGLLRKLVGAILVALPVIALHGGYFPLIVTYVCYAVYLQLRSKDYLQLFAIVGVAAISAVVLALVDSTGTIQAFVIPARLYNRLSGRLLPQEALHAGSAYLVGLKIENVPQMILQAPLRMLYFFVSPMPWDWRGLQDAVAFVGDSAWHVLCLAVLMWYWATHVWGSNPPNSSLAHRTACVCALMLMLVGVVWGFASHNAGSALRHRVALAPVEVIAVATCLHKKGETIALGERIGNKGR